MKNIILNSSFILLFIVVFSTTASAQKDRFYKHYVGIFADTDKGSLKTTQKNVVLNLRREGDLISGTFFFAEGSAFYSLSGKIKKDGMEVMQYDSKMYLKGTFKCKFEGENAISGSWIDADPVNGGNHEVKVNFTENYQNSVKLTALNGSKVYHIDGKDDMPEMTIDIDYLVPSEYTKSPNSIAPLGSSLETVFFGIYKVQNNPQQNIINKINSNLTDYKNIVEKQFKGNMMKSGSNDMYNRKNRYTLDIVYNDNNILTIKKDSLQEAGTEIVASGSTYFVYDMATGKQITVKDIFDNPKYKDQMYDLFTKKIKTWLQIETDKALMDGGFDKEAYAANTNFLVDKSGISFYFGPFEVNQDYVLVFFPYNEISSFIKEKSPISHLYPKDLVFNKTGSTGAIKENKVIENKQNDKKKTEVEEDNEEGDVIINEKEGDVIVRPKNTPKKK